MHISYTVNSPLTVDQFINLLEKTSLGVRRPLHERHVMQGMLDHADLTVTAWSGEQLVGVARSVTDFNYACYLSDLAVHENFQKCGIGLRLQELTQAQLGPYCSLVLLAAPAAKHYYQKLGYDYVDRCWMLPRDKVPGKAE